jgi:hypothetical protein
MYRQPFDYDVPPDQVDEEEEDLYDYLEAMNDDRRFEESREE